jgi:hypothetical protein
VAQWRRPRLASLVEAVAASGPAAARRQRGGRGRGRLGTMGNAARGGSAEEATGNGVRRSGAWRCGGPAVAKQSGVGGWARHSREEMTQRASGRADEMDG